ncbi:MAG: hypothetical protein KGI54_09560 [Pseudomonadota bacterium]|nr:hypothetical protein [Pseudomonadota bacterium]
MKIGIFDPELMECKYIEKIIIHDDVMNSIFTMKVEFSAGPSILETYTSRKERTKALNKFPYNLAETPS